ncbi:MAG: XdhC family protein [Chloroflexota bacterium]|nr:XdhC family protein [Chloroflexota bacterium]
MQAVIREAVRLLEQGESCVLATVVHTKGSTPQKPGAKLLVRQDGSGVGTLGGGCVEGDIWFAAKEALKSRSGPIYRDYFLNEEIAARDGLVCGGAMYFLIEPLLEPRLYLPMLREIVAAYDGGTPVGLASVLKSAPGREDLGAHLLVRLDGATVGTLGSPSADEEAARAARRVADMGRCQHLELSDSTELFVEGFTTPPTLVLLGGGHIARATAPMARSLGFRLYVVDDRPQFASKQRFPEAEETIVADFVEGLSHVPVNANTFIVVATRGHRYDDMALEAAARTPARYVGLVGSRRKTILIFQELLKHGVPDGRVRELHAPIGLDIGALTPEEIAVSIMAEITMTRLGGAGRPLRLEERHFQRAASKAAG